MDRMMNTMLLQNDHESLDRPGLVRCDMCQCMRRTAKYVMIRAHIMERDVYVMEKVNSPEEQSDEDMVCVQKMKEKT